jgi:tetratricopeptide (TPR) repeat protein
MNTLRLLFSALAFRPEGLRALGARHALVLPILGFAAGFAAFVLVRSSVYAGLPEVSSYKSGRLDAFLHLNLVQAVLFLSVVYVPAIVCLSNALAGDGLGWTVSRDEYRFQVSAFFPLWMALFLLAAPLQWLAPQFLILGPVGISIGLLVLVLMLAVYTVWAIRELNHISVAASLGVFALSWATLPFFYLLSSFLMALPLFILIPLGIIAYRRFQGYFDGRSEEISFQKHLHALTANPQDADAQYQLGLIHLRRGNLEPARHYFESSIQIDSKDPDYHYYLGLIHEKQGDWSAALGSYEETYRLRPDYGQGDIFREVGKAYLHTGECVKAIEFLEFFLRTRGSDPEGRFWLAVALDRLGKKEEMRLQLTTILNQARSQPRFFRKEKREWVYRSRMLLRGR